MWVARINARISRSSDERAAALNAENVRLTGMAYRAAASPVRLTNLYSQRLAYWRIAGTGEPATDAMEEDAFPSNDDKPDLPTVFH